MNREVIFRGKLSHSGEWVLGSLLKIGSKYHIVTKSDMYEDGHHIRQESDTPTRVDPNTVGQYTGLKDKNGKRVFEGDILRVKEYKNLCWDLSKNREEIDEIRRTFTLNDLKGELDKEYISAVVVEEGTYCLSSNGDYNDMFLSCLFGEMNGSQPIFDFEVIGNIHDNPELLKKE